MRAVLVKQHGPPSALVIEEVPSPPVGSGQVLVDVYSCGINFPDTLIIQGKYQFQPPLPFSPGGEIAGVVRKVGEGVSAVSPGDRVIALLGWGGFAEQVVAEEEKVIKIPSFVPFHEAAAFLMTYGTSLYALKDRGHLKAGESVLILGASGGVGLSAIQLSKALGATVIAAASSDEKLQTCREAGADFVINYEKEDLRKSVMKVTKGAGVDVVYDPVGDKYAEPCVRSMAWGGRYLVIGFAGGKIPKIPLNLPLLKGCALVGVFWGAHTAREGDKHRENVRQLFSLWQEGKIKPLVSKVYSLEQAPQALEDMMGRRVRGKAVIATRPSPSKL